MPWAALAGTPRVREEIWTILKGSRTLAPAARERLVVEVEGELVRVRAQPEGVHLVLALVVDPGRDDVRGEHVPLEQEGVVTLERLTRLVERAGRLRDVLRHLGRHGVDVLVERLARVDLVLDAVKV